MAVRLVLVVACSSRLAWGARVSTGTSALAVDDDDEALLNTPFGTEWADECPEVKKHSAPPEALPTDELRILGWNVEWAFSPQGKRVEWMQKVVDAAKYEAGIRCPQDMFDPTLVGRGFKDGHPCSSQEAMEGHLRDVAAYLGGINPPPHIVSVEELDGCTALLNISQKLPHHKPYLIYGNGYGTTQQVGFLSLMAPTGDIRRFTLEAPTPASDNEHCNVEQGDVGLTKHYVAKFEVPGKLRFYMIGVHLKAAGQAIEGQACSFREAEAKVLDGILQQLYDEDEEAEVILLGDFNDFDPKVRDRRGAWHFERYGEEFPLGSVEGCRKQRDGSFLKVNITDDGNTGQKSRVFDIIRGSGGTRPKLENLMGRVERKRRYSKMVASNAPFRSTCGAGRWSGERECGAKRPASRIGEQEDVRDCPGDELLDYILVTPGLANAVKEVRVLNDGDFEEAYADKRYERKTEGGDGESVTFDSSALDEKRKARDKDRAAKGHNPSDHFPVMVSIDLTKFGAAGP